MQEESESLSFNTSYAHSKSSRAPKVRGGFKLPWQEVLRALDVSVLCPSPLSFYRKLLPPRSPAQAPSTVAQPFHDSILYSGLRQWFSTLPAYWNTLGSFQKSQCLSRPIKTEFWQQCFPKLPSSFFCSVQPNNPGLRGGHWLILLALLED